MDELAADLRGARARVHAKLRFSMLAEGVELGASTAHAFLCGIEAHVCVAQTASDLLARGIAVSIVVDGVSSQRRGDRARAARHSPRFHLLALVRALVHVHPRRSRESQPQAPRL